MTDWNQCPSWLHGGQNEQGGRERETKGREGEGKEQSTNKSRGIQALVYIQGDGHGAPGPDSFIILA